MNITVYCGASVGNKEIYREEAAKFGGCYNNLKNYYDDMVKNGFLSQRDRSKVLFAVSFNEIDKFIKEYEPPVVRQYKK